MGYSTSTKSYIRLLAVIGVTQNITVAHDSVSSLMDYVKPIYRSELGERYSEPMLWIGLYIALASLCCILAMAADLVHGVRSRKLWFPCKYFSVNAFSLTVISVAMKLPVDLSGSMPGDVDQVAKLGSMAFLCTMMANLLPCLATMDSNELLTNITALGVMVITLVVNVCIQIETGVISYKEDAHLISTVAAQYDLESLGINKSRNTIIAIVYVIFLLLLLIIYACSSLVILESKEIIESKYQQGHKRASKDIQQSQEKILTVEKLQQHMRNYFLMAGSGNPQFIIACAVTTTASGVICAFTAILHTVTMGWSISAMLNKNYDSDYKWSMVAILIIQFIGVLLGTVAPLSRCFATLSFKVSTESISKHMKVFKVESYWTQKLYDWKHDTIRFPFRSRSLKVVIITLKNQILNFCVEFQEGVVVVCKIVALVPFFFMICVWYCLRYLKWLLQAGFSSSRKRTGMLEPNPYVLQLEDEMELAERTLEGLTKSMNRLIQKGERKQPSILRKLILERSTIGFQGVKRFDNGHYVPSLLSKVEYQDCWSLRVVTLTTIAITLNKIEKHVEFKSLLKSVREGLDYVILVEESLNATDDYGCFQKAAEALWQEVDVYHKWLGDKLQDIASQVNRAACQEDKTREILELFLEKAKTKIVEGVGSTENGGGPNGHSKCTSICAYSMCRITKTILDDKESQKNLFTELSTTIADIMAACLINLPQVIAIKCHTSVIEKRTTCVQAAAKLLGETKQIINTLQNRDVPSMNPDDIP